MKVKLPRLEDTTFHLYYLFILNYLLTAHVWHRLTEPLLIPLSPHFVVSWIPSELYEETIKYFCLLALSSTCILIVHFRNRTVKILLLISWVIYFGHESSFGKSNNDHYASTFSMVALLFLPRNGEERQKTDQVLFIAKFQAVMCYAMAGIWKVRFIPSLIIAGDVLTNLGNAIAMEHIKYGRVAGSISKVGRFFMDRDYLTGPMYYVLVCIQTFSPLLIIDRKVQIFFGVMVCLFHILSELILNINFRSNMYIMMVLFFYDPLMREIKSHLDQKKRPPEGGLYGIT